MSSDTAEMESIIDNKAKHCAQNGVIAAQMQIITYNRSFVVKVNSYAM